MKIELPYGESFLTLKMARKTIKQIFEVNSLPEVYSESELVVKALETPVNSLPLHQIVKPGETACIVVGDITRLWVRHHVLLPRIIDELNRGGIPDENITIISATGGHREQTKQEHQKLVGLEVFKRVRVTDHRNSDSDQLIYVGTTSFGTPVWLNKQVVQVDRVILTGGVVYHFLAGWGGGKKAIVPGVAGFETIMKNHSMAFYSAEGRGLNPEVCAGRLQGNPCNEDMLEGTAFISPDFLVNTVINDMTHRIAYVSAGDYNAAHLDACRFVEQHYGVPCKEKANLVIASCGGYPKDINFYQAYKTLYNAHFALKPGGFMILIAECREGIGSSDLWDIFRKNSNRLERERVVREKYTIGGHMGYHSSVIADDYNVLLYSNLQEDIVKKMGMIPLHTLEEGLAIVNDSCGKTPPAYIMPYGGSTFPIVEHI